MSPGRRGRPGRIAGRRSPRPWLVFITLGILVTGAWLLKRNALHLPKLDWPARPRGEICQVDRVFDGDSLRVLCGDGPVEVRLHCIDAPERDQVPWAKQSRRHLREAASRAVELVPVDKDRFGRLVAEVYGVAPERPLLNLEQVAGGHAAVYRRYCDDPRYEDAEREAREAERGIWSRPGDQQTPWLFRAQHRR
jgi:endonuclease YncB( thermonuclease family)